MPKDRGSRRREVLVVGRKFPLPRRERPIYFEFDALKWHILVHPGTLL